MKRWVVLSAGILASAACIVWLWRSADTDIVVATVKTAGLTWWLVAAAIYLLGFWIRAIRWRVMLASIDDYRTSDLWRSIVLGYAGNNVLPFRLGELVRAIVFGKLTQGSRTTGMASIVSERLLDGMTLGFILVLALWSSASLGGVSEGLTPVFVGAGALVAAGIVLVLVSCLFLDQIVAMADRISPRLGSVAQRCAAAVDFMRQPRLFIRVLSLSGLVWLIEGFMFVVFADALGLPNPLLVGYLSLAVINFGILIPAAPGYFGLFQAAAVIAFASIGLNTDLGLAFGVLVHSAQFIPLTLLGLLLAVPHWSELVRIKSHPPSANVHG